MRNIVSRNKTVLVIFILLILMNLSVFTNAAEMIDSEGIEEEASMSSKYFEYLSDFSTALNDTFNLMVGLISVIITSIALFFGVNIYNQTKYMKEIKEEIKEEIKDLKEYKNKIEGKIEEVKLTFDKRTEKINRELEIKSAFTIFRMKLNAADNYFNKNKDEEALSELVKIKNIEDQLFKFLESSSLTLDNIFQKKNAQKLHMFNTLKDYKYTYFLIKARKESTISSDDYVVLLFKIDRILIENKENNSSSLKEYFDYKMYFLKFIVNKYIDNKELKETFDLLVYELNLFSYSLYKDQISKIFDKNRHNCIKRLNEKITNHYLQLGPRLIQIKYNYLEYTRSLLEQGKRKRTLENFNEDFGLIEEFRYFYNSDNIEEISDTLPFNESNINNTLYLIFRVYDKSGITKAKKLREDYFKKIQEEDFIWSLYNSGNEYFDNKGDIYNAYVKYKKLKTNCNNKFPRNKDLDERIQKIEEINQDYEKNEELEKKIDKLIVEIVQVGDFYA